MDNHDKAHYVAHGVMAAVEKASGDVLKVTTVVAPHALFYLAFGKITEK